MDNVSLLAWLQLEKIIGKLKTEKYGSRILEEITTYQSDEEQNRAAKRPKAKKGLVVIESSEEEES